MSKDKIHPLKVIGIMLILFGLPLGSWLSMKQGADFRMAAIEELGEYGEISDFELDLPNGEKLIKSDVSKKVLMVNFLPEKDIAKSEHAKQLKWIQEQFQERLLKRTDFMFLSHVVKDSLTDLKKLGTELEIGSSNFRRWTIAAGDKNTLEKLALESYKLPLKDGESALNNPYLAIVDMDSEVRSFYNIFEKEEIAKLMMHLSLLLPQQDDRKVDIKTEAGN